AIEEQIGTLEDPLAETYRRYLSKEIGMLRQKLDDASDRAEAGDVKARRLLGDATARFEAANQEGDLLAITRLKDGRLRGYHPKLNAIRWKQISIVFQGAMNALNPVYTVGKVADRIAVMYAGQIVEEAPSQDLFHRTLHPYTEGLLGAFPSVKGEKHRLEAIPGSPPSLLTPPSGCRFHPRCKYAKDIC